MGGTHSHNHDHGHHHGHSHDHHAHGHGHEHGHDHCHGNASRGRLGLAAILTGLFMIVEIIGGFISGSLALLADAGHMMTDFAALSMAWLAFVLAARPATSKLTFGYARLPVLAAFVNGIALFVISLLIINAAWHRYFHIESHEVLAGPMLWVAIGGLLVNMLVFWILQSGDKDNLNVRGALLHVIGDMLGSAAAIIAALVIMQTGYMAIDPLLSVLVAVLILRSAWYLIKDSAHILLEGAPKSLDTDAIRHSLIGEIGGRGELGPMNIWSLTDGEPMMTLSIKAGKDTNPLEFSDEIRHYLSHEFGLDNVTVDLK